jgi:hypothetical protein
VKVPDPLFRRKIKAPTAGLVERSKALLVSASPTVIAAFPGIVCPVSVSLA